MAPSRAVYMLRQRFALLGQFRQHTAYGSSVSTLVTQRESYSGICARATLKNATQPLSQSLLTARQSWSNSVNSLRYQVRQLSSAAAKESAESLEPPDYLNEKEKELFELLKAELSPTSLEVADVSGGCGSMYAVNVTSERFKGLPMVKQHRLVNEILGDEIKNWHGLQLRTKVPA